MMSKLHVTGLPGSGGGGIQWTLLGQETINLTEGKTSAGIAVPADCGELLVVEAVTTIRNYNPGTSSNRHGGYGVIAGTDMNLFAETGEVQVGKTATAGPVRAVAIFIRDFWTGRVLYTSLSDPYDSTPETLEFSSTGGRIQITCEENSGFSTNLTGTIKVYGGRLALQ